MVSRKDCEAASCWTDADQVVGNAAMTTFKRRARLHQAQWREARNLPRGSSPYVGGPNAKPIGSRLELEFARETCANFLTSEAIAAVRYGFPREFGVRVKTSAVMQMVDRPEDAVPRDPVEAASRVARTGARRRSAQVFTLTPNFPNFA